jgi:hypothetical protein
MSNPLKYALKHLARHAILHGIKELPKITKEVTEFTSKLIEDRKRKQEDRKRQQIEEQIQKKFLERQ